MKSAPSLLSSYQIESLSPLLIAVKDLLDKNLSNMKTQSTSSDPIVSTIDAA